MKTPRGRDDAGTRLAFGALTVCLDPVWASVFARSWPTRLEPEQTVLLEHGPVSRDSASIDRAHAPGLRGMQLGPEVFRAGGPPGMMALRAALRWVLVRALAPAGGMLVHAAAIEIDGGAHLLFGPPGAGKTTLSRNAGRRAIADESVVLWPEGRAWFVCGTPWSSDGGEPGVSVKLPLSRIAWLEKAPLDRFEPRPPSEVALRLAAEVYPAQGVPTALLSGAILACLRACEHGRLRFTRDHVHVG